MRLIDALAGLLHRRTVDEEYPYFLLVRGHGLDEYKPRRFVGPFASREQARARIGSRWTRQSDHPAVGASWVRGDEEIHIARYRRAAIPAEKLVSPSEWEG